MSFGGVEVLGCVERQRRFSVERSRPRVDGLMAWLKAERRRLSAKSQTATAIDYVLKRRRSFTRFLDDGRICLSNNAAERALRCIAVDRRN